MLAIETLSWMEMQKLSERSAIAKTVRQLDVSDSDAVRLAYRLVCETVRRRNYIDRYINKVAKPRTVGEYELGIQAFLRLYVYQTRIARKWSRPDVEEAETIVKLVRSILGWRTTKEVESILGELLTQEPDIVLEGATDEEKVGLSTFHPVWFVKYCFNIFGRSNAVIMLEADNQTLPTYIRLNTLRASEDVILEKLAAEGIQIKKVEHLRFAYEIKNTRAPLTGTTSFQEGLFYIQDKASCFAAEVANPQPGMTLLEVCAAPGAKTTYLAQLMQNRGTIYSIDYSKRRMGIWKREVGQMGVKIAEPVIADACELSPLTKEADVVVLDPPCTGSGNFARSPSSKWRLTSRSIDKMAEIQWRMLEKSAVNVKPGGTLVYSTCSITLEENEMLVEKFLKRNCDFLLAEATPKIGLPGLRGLDICQRLFPHIHMCNGFFIAKLIKNL
jgi:16S rRNA (cytosine967-C5)-methyltransferase